LAGDDKKVGPSNQRCQVVYLQNGETVEATDGKFLEKLKVRSLLKHIQGDFRQLDVASLCDGNHRLAAGKHMFEDFARKSKPMDKFDGFVNAVCAHAPGYGVLI
jgi:hypothetical protein